ncbi:META domain-containing protein [Candidatus Binatia bacterium]|nr:META domain-containing protein [Candidatus Binatia bacterium]
MRVAIGVALAATLSACASAPWAPPGSGVLVAPGDLVGTEWELQNLGGHAVVDFAEATLTFPEEGKIAGNGSCNRFVGTVKIEGETIKVGPLAATRRVCHPSVMAQEIKYLKSLEDGERIVTDGSTLLIFTTDKEHPLRFSRE